MFIVPQPALQKIEKFTGFINKIVVTIQLGGTQVNRTSITAKDGK